MKRYGLVGYPLSHSFSQNFFTEKFKRENITGCLYQNFSLQAIEELPAVLEAFPDIAGLNVTIPYKEKVIPFLTSQSEVVRAIGACNCIKIDNGILSGYNTDVTGFEISLQQYLQPHHTKALVLGTGGAAKAVHFVLKKLGISFLEVSRSAKGDGVIAYEQVTPALLEEYLLIINTTPLGMYPHVHEYPSIPYTALTPQHYLFDLIYNPRETVFLQKGKEQGTTIKNGSAMLVIQAEESWKIWNS